MQAFNLQFLEDGNISVSSNMPIPNAKSPFDFKKVPLEKSLELFKHLAAHGVITLNAKPLIADFFAKVDFYYEVSKDLTLSGVFVSGKTIPIKNCTHIGPSWFIAENKLRAINANIAFSEIKNLPRTLSKKELADLLKGDIKVNLLFDQEKPLPLLILKDAKGLFADLMMSSSDEMRPFSLSIKEDLYWEKDLLETGYQKRGIEYYCPLDKVEESLRFLIEMGWTVQDSKGRKILIETTRSIASEQDQQRIKLQGKLHFGSQAADLVNVFDALGRKERFIDLGEGKSGLLSENDPLIALGEEIEKFESTCSLKIAFSGLLEPDLQTWNRPGFHSTEPSPLFLGALRPYQKKGLDWLFSLYESHLHGILGDEMGLGKTIQILAFLSNHPLKNHLIVVPTSLLFNWEKEIQKFLPSFSLYRHHGSKRLETIPDSGIILTSYHTLLNDLPLFQNKTWDSLIIDEAQIVKNSNSQLASSLYTLKSRFRIAMTGTIIENHAKELWSHFHFLMPGFLPSFDQPKKIQKLISPFILRRKKEDVVKDLPPLEEYTVFVEMTENQKSAYTSYLANAKKSSYKNKLEIFEVLLRLRQIACHPLLVSHLLEGNSLESAKLQALLIDLEVILEEKKKALIFSQFASMLHLIARELTKKNIPFCLLEGATKNREQEVQKFQEDPNIPFFLMTLKAGGVGLNLTAADYVLLYDPWWHDAIDAQAIARAHRIGQTKPVIAKRYITAKTIEEKILQLKEEKNKLFKNLLDEEADSLSDADLDFLLS